MRPRVKPPAGGAGSRPRLRPEVGLNLTLPNRLTKVCYALRRAMENNSLAQRRHLAPAMRAVEQQARPSRDRR